MNNLLIVDDEILTVNIIKGQYRWQELGISEVYTACSVSQAIGVLERQTVDILICDIEMGIHSGLELLEWIQGRRLPIVSFVLTGYAEFDYCQRALELGCIGYVLKPIQYDELKKVVISAVKKADEQKAITQCQRQSEQWKNNASNLTTQFWTDVISNTVASNRQAIKRKAERMGIPLCPDGRFLLLLSHWVQAPGDGLSRFRRDELRYALNNMALDIFDGLAGEIPAFISDSNYYILRQTGGPEAQIERLIKDCQQMNSYAQEYLSTRLVFCLSGFLPLEELSVQFQRIYAFFQRQNPLSDGVLLFNQCAQQDHFYYKPNIPSWMLLLETGRSAELGAMITQYLDLCADQDILSVSTLEQFQRDFERMLGAVSQKYGISDFPVQREPWRELDPAGVKARCLSLVSLLSARLNPDKQVQSIVDRAKVYVEEHILDGDIARSSIAQALGINPEYLSRAFKKQEGVSLLEYISAKKIELACGMLRRTELSVSDISSRLGYINFSYFSQLFRKYTGMNPAAYRKMARS